ncbi:sulfur oxidation c-type cytochrome SoxX [Roseateles oligotrophus]|uniref:Sulfur oxidation c-type cytochrome SoxX n=1 Tax=Roseateles oligotrophus TaxID=1769250 RepID=A0ABT2YLS7_9BURK|nr:sulfur oxidation c-type cytochrome SoxX [Roseateles oligotrophus]MCV2371025.1 sulfur oxidation c-type cytochrome SoxX [Roseateles oligotrophus]
MKPNKQLTLMLGGAITLLLAGCAATTPVPDYEALLTQMMSGSFRDEGIAKTERLQQDSVNLACSKAQGAALPDAVAAPLQAAALKSVPKPANGQYLGDWREGEKLAQNGRGMTWTDKSAAPSANGGNCYNCHQISKAELSFGTIGPSLYQYGKLRGVSDPQSAAAAPIVDYTWAKLWNAKAFNACSEMPRFGHGGLLDETQLKHLMALLLDPQSPVNQ